MILPILTANERNDLLLALERAAEDIVYSDSPWTPPDELEEGRALAARWRALASRLREEPDLTKAEALHLSRLSWTDRMARDAYTVRRGEQSAHAFADNGEAMVADLTLGTDIEADSITEADEVVAGIALPASMDPS